MSNVGGGSPCVARVRIMVRLRIRVRSESLIRIRFRFKNRVRANTIRVSCVGGGLACVVVAAAAPPGAALASCISCRHASKSEPPRTSRPISTVVICGSIQ